MVQHSRDAEFTDYVTAKAAWLRRIAYLLSADWHRADDLVQTAITKLYINWHRAGRVEDVDGYARKTLVNTFLAEQRSPWRRRITLPGRTADRAGSGPDLDAALDLRTALAALPERQRAAVVLRYYCDLSVEETAHCLGCAPGTVKSQTARALATLRRGLDHHVPVPSSEGSQS
ncbi:SigE family RNA polymerase sigma factor [Virgisporangium aurantiacum]|uniref:RNA polymerase sigma24 factor n=1 Tax=Virgisporangium aurantiacum TaxID=175570 RepID=A0A8J4E5N5_9ACTN|nr:SigE family RNA polymerase sigma factor [Virgisporangium aurantiacum]GIJ62304.1 RNA polymerase sigma24 factor [Virgisporangium aurantiacum]